MRSLNKDKKRCNSDVCSMQTARCQSTIEHISPMGVHLLMKEGALTCDAKEAYGPLQYLLEREKSKVEGDEVLCLLQREVSFNESQDETTDKSKHRQAQIKRLLRQMKERRQQTAIKSTRGELLTGPREVGQELPRFWGHIMASNGASKSRARLLFGRQTGEMEHDGTLLKRTYSINGGGGAVKTGSELSSRRRWYSSGILQTISERVFEEYHGGRGRSAWIQTSATKPDDGHAETHS